MKHDYKKTTHLSAWLTAFMCVLLFTSSGVVAQDRNDERERYQIEANNDMIQIRTADDASKEHLASPRTGNLSESFEGTAFPPAGWTRFPATGGNNETWWRGNAGVNAHDGSFVAVSSSWLSGFGAINADNWLITPRLTVSDGDNTFAFFGRSSCPSFRDPIAVYISTEGNQIADFETNLLSVDLVPGAWTSYTIDLSAYNGQDVYLGFHHLAFDNCSIWIDSVTGPALFVPETPAISVSPLAFGSVFDINPASSRALEITNIGVGDLTVEFSSASGELTVTGFPLTIAPGESETATVELNAVGLPAGAYSGTISLTSNDPDNATVDVAVTATIIEPVVTSFLQEGFETTPSGQRPAGWTGTFTTFLTGGIGNSRRLSRNLYGTIPSANFITSFVEMGDEPEMSFFYRVVNFSGYPSTPTPATSVAFTVFISTNFGDTFVPIWVYDPDEHVVSTNYAQVTIDVSAYSNQTVLFGVSASRSADDFYLDFDDFTIGTPPSVPQFGLTPSGSHAFGTVTLGNSASQQFVVSNDGGGTLSVTSAVITGTHSGDFTVTGFTAGDLGLAETMNFNVVFEPTAGGDREATLTIIYNDGEEDSAEVALTGTGFDSTIRSPFVENFNIIPPSNWEQRYGILSEDTQFIAPVGQQWFSNNFVNIAVNGTSARINLWNAVARWLITPTIDLNDLGSANTLKFDLGVTGFNNTIPNQLGPNDIFAVVISTDNGATWSSNNIIFSKNGAEGDQIKPGGETFYVDLSAYSGEVKLGFYAGRTSGADPDIHFFLTNVGIHETVSQSRSAAGWNVMSMPANNIRVRELAAQNLVQGVPGANGFYGTDGVNYEAFASNLYFYGNVAAGGGVPDGDGSPESWVSPTNFSTRIASGQGFIWYFFDTPNTGIPTTPLPFNLNAIGLEPTTDVVRALNTATSHSLLGNPFNYTIPAGNVTGPIQGSVQVWDGDSFVPATNIPAFTGFFAEKNADGDVTIAADPGMTSADSDQSIIVFHLDGVAQDGAAVRDHATRIVFRDQATQGWDIHDLTKLYSLNYPSVALSVIGEREGNQVNKVIDSRPAEISETIEIPLALDVFAFSGSFTLSAELIDVPEAWTILLTDMETGISVDLRQQAYTFEYESASTASHPDFATTFGGTALQSEDTNGRFVVTIHPVTTNLEPGADLPTVFALNQNYPNPFNPTTQLSYDLPESADVRLDVFNVMGQRVATLVNATQNAGRYNVTFDARNLASGVYIYRLQAGSHVMTKKMTLVK